MNADAHEDASRRTTALWWLCGRLRALRGPGPPAHRPSAAAGGGASPGDGAQPAHSEAVPARPKPYLRRACHLGEQQSCTRTVGVLREVLAANTGAISARGASIAATATAAAAAASFLYIHCVFVPQATRCLRAHTARILCSPPSSGVTKPDQQSPGVISVLAVDAALPTARTASVLRHEVSGPMDVSELTRVVKVQAGAFERAVGVGGAVVKVDGVAIGLVGMAPGLAVLREEMRGDPR